MLGIAYAIEETGAEQDAVLVVATEDGSTIHALVHSPTSLVKLVGELLFISQEDGILAFPFSPFSARENLYLAFEAAPAGGRGKLRVVQDSSVTGKPASALPATQETKVVDQEVRDLIRQAASFVPPEPDGWAPLGRLGSELVRLDPTFSSRKYGFSKLGQLLTACGSSFQVRHEKGAGHQVYFRIRTRE